MKMGLEVMGTNQDSNDAKNISNRCDMWHHLKLEPCDEGPSSEVFQRQYLFEASTLHTG